MVELKDGRKGIVFNRDAADIQNLYKGKVPVYLLEPDVQASLFPGDTGATGEVDPKRILCNPADLKIIGYYD